MNHVHKILPYARRAILGALILTVIGLAVHQILFSSYAVLWLMLIVTGLANLVSWMLLAINVWAGRQAGRSANLDKASILLYQRDILIDVALVAWTATGVLLTGYWLVLVFTASLDQQPLIIGRLWGAAFILMPFFGSMAVVQVASFIMRDKQDNELAKSSGREKVDRALVIRETTIPQEPVQTLIDGAPYVQPASLPNGNGNGHGKGNGKQQQAEGGAG